MIGCRDRLGLGCWLAAAVVVLSVCDGAVAQRGKSKEELKKEGEKLFTPGGGAGGGGGGGGQGAKQEAYWSIVIEGFRGDEQESVAMQALEKVRTQGGLKEAYLEQREKATVVAIGKFADGTSKAARDMLAKVRNTEVVVAGVTTKPFAGSFLAPPANIPGSLPEYDLRQAKKRNGEWVIYTLQIGVYTRLDKAPDAKELAEFRKAAELAVTQLRREGEQAFYYHGPTKSMVTVGLFGADDYNIETRIESPTLTMLRKRYPHNLFNGQGLKESVKVTNQQGKQVTTQRMQPSALVEVPKSD